MFLRENTEQGSSKKGTLQVAMVLRGGAAIHSFTLFFVAFYVLYYSTTNMSYVYPQKKLPTPNPKECSGIHPPLSSAPRHAPVVRGGKKPWRSECCFSRALRLGQGCSRVAVRGMGMSCRVAVIPIASVRLGLHSSLTAFQRRTQSQIDNNT